VDQRWLSEWVPMWFCGSDVAFFFSFLEYADKIHGVGRKYSGAPEMALFAYLTSGNMGASCCNRSGLGRSELGSTTACAHLPSNSASVWRTRAEDVKAAIGVFVSTGLRAGMTLLVPV